ncbi:hypothetical protein FA95DRAFT_1607917 [Auriscalpium vulgare]|uniref:Uncharacterized protein n=1 Tax=Auriscalpium vulgare TaxID=40419 RepID=A0ACB8RNT7_9AGAM|nr:hypothetical protein FA95DRAFT_1607917 [Auriscalpium vulgare]
MTLPPGLLDLTILRLSSQATMRRTATLLGLQVGKRRMHQALLVSLPAPQVHLPPQQERPRGRRRSNSMLPVRRQEDTAGPSQVLARRVEALAEIAREEAPMEAFTYSENELLAFYEDVLRLPEPSRAVAADATTESQAQIDKAIVERLARSFVPESLSPTSQQSAFSVVLNQREGLPESPLPPPPTVARDTSLSHQRVLERLQEITPGLEAAQRRLSPLVDQTTAPNFHVPVALLSYDEWKALVRNCLQSGDLQSAEAALDLMRRTGVPLLEESVNDVMGYYATKGDVSGIEEFMKRFLTERPTDRQRHLHIKAHEISSPPGSVPTGALELLHRYENQSLPAPITSYTRLIGALFHTSSSLAHAQAWDLFAHMRYVAHPHPDALLYTLMIRACAPPSGAAEPERALDLFAEMTNDRRLAPTEGAYSAVILSCARSGTKVYVNEAFRLAKEMLDSHRDAHGRSSHRPEGRTFTALLEGAKRIGDLARARWILAELVKATRPDGGCEDVVDAVIDDAIMMHVFHAYAAYRPPFKRSIAPLVERDPQLVSPAGSDEARDPASNQQTSVIEASTNPSFKHLPPQSRIEVVNEAKSLFSRMLPHSSHPEQFIDGNATAAFPFQNVALSTRLLNAYMSIFYAHDTLDVSRVLFSTLYAERGVDKNERSYIEALERCGKVRAPHDKEVALSFAEAVWAEWAALENAGQLASGRPLSVRMIERAHAAMIRVLALSGETQRALAHLRGFMLRYPPTAVRVPAALPAMRSTRTALVGTRPLVRLSSALDVPDDTVPPLIGFADLEILHHRLVARGDRDGIAFVKYVCHAYQGALKARRAATLLGRALP